MFRRKAPAAQLAALARGAGRGLIMEPGRASGARPPPANGYRRMAGAPLWMRSNAGQTAPAHMSAPASATEFPDALAMTSPGQRIHQAVTWWPLVVACWFLLFAVDFLSSSPLNAAEREFGGGALAIGLAILGFEVWRRRRARSLVTAGARIAVYRGETLETVADLADVSNLGPPFSVRRLLHPFNLEGIRLAILSTVMGLACAAISLLMLALAVNGHAAGFTAAGALPRALDLGFALTTAAFTVNLIRTGFYRTEIRILAPGRRPITVLLSRADAQRIWA